MRNERRVDHKLNADMRHRPRRALADAEVEETLPDEPLALEERGRFVEDGIGLVVKPNPVRHPRLDRIDREARHRGKIRQHGSERKRWIFGYMEGEDGVSEVVHGFAERKFCAINGLRMIERAPAGRRLARVLSSTQLSPRANLVRFQVEGAYDYAAGQFVAVRFGGALEAYYSFASAPDSFRPGEFELCVATFERPELARMLETAGEVKISDPLGGVPFSIEDSPLWLFGMGTGVAPLRAIVQARSLHLRGVSLVVGHKDSQNSLFHGEFQGLAQEGLDYRPFVSQERGAWQFGRGRIQDEVSRLLVDAAPALSEVRAIVCGNQAMASSVAGLLESAGLRSSQIHQEGY